MYRVNLAVLAAFAASAIAQNLPDCANKCVGGDYAGCSQFDIACICNSSGYISTLACCVSQTCSSADQDQTIQFANKICAGVGITNLPQSASCSASASSASSAPSATVLASAVSAPPVTTSAASSPTVVVGPPVSVGASASSSGEAAASSASGSSASSSASSAAASSSAAATSSKTSSGSGSATSSAAGSSSSPGAANINKAGSVGLGAVVAGLAFAL